MPTTKLTLVVPLPPMFDAYATDIINAALGRLKLPSSEVLMVGDTPYDIEAAGRAGVRTVAFRSGGWTDRGLQGAIAVYAGPWDLLEHFDSSPFVAKDAKR